MEANPLEGGDLANNVLQIFTVKIKGFVSRRMMESFILEFLPQNNVKSQRATNLEPIIVT